MLCPIHLVRDAPYPDIRGTLDVTYGRSIGLRYAPPAGAGGLPTLLALTTGPCHRR